MKNYIWGTEIWSLSAHRDGDCKIKNNENNLTLSRLFYPEKFPAMIKIIDAKMPLSVQVHPDNDYAAKFENDTGKTEMWQIIAHEPDAFLYLGFNGNYSRSEVEEAINRGNLTDLLNKITVHTGDKFFIPAGTVHAIGGGILLAETQQNSNLTYRVYDYNRTGADGRPRELHVKKALDVMKLSPADISIPDDAPFKSEIIKIKKGDKIKLGEMKINGVKLNEMKFNAKGRFFSAILISGAASMSLNKLDELDEDKNKNENENEENENKKIIKMSRYQAVCFLNQPERDLMFNADNQDAEILIAAIDF